MEKQTVKTEEEIIEEVERFYRQYTAPICHRTETDPIIDAYFEKKHEEARILIAKAKFPPNWGNM
jgi:hypothetical protein